MKKENVAVENPFMCNPFDVFGLEPSFNIDLKALDKIYFDLQKKHHPDQRNVDNVLSFESDASMINASYQKLKHPLKRAEALLNLLSLPLEDAESSDPSGVLASVFEFQEALALCEDEEEALAIKEDIDEAFITEQARFGELFDQGHYEELPEIYIKMSYLNRLREHMKDIEENFFKRKSVLH